MNGRDTHGSANVGQARPEGEGVSLRSALPLPPTDNATRSQSTGGTMVDRDAALRECHAYSLSGQKCSHPAGHPGDHAIIITWTDAECWSPNPNAMPNGGFTTAIITGPAVEHLVDIPAPSGKCVICSHPMHSGMCNGVDSDDVGCNCSNGVEE